MAAYALTHSPGTVLRLADQAFIPTDPANLDYLAYLAWVNAGNTPDPAPGVPAAHEPPGG